MARVAKVDALAVSTEREFTSIQEHFVEMCGLYRRGHSRRPPRHDRRINTSTLRLTDWKSDSTSLTPERQQVRSRRAAFRRHRGQAGPRARGPTARAPAPAPLTGRYPRACARCDRRTRSSVGACSFLREQPRDLRFRNSFRDDPDVLDHDVPLSIDEYVAGNASFAIRGRQVIVRERETVAEVLLLREGFRRGSIHRHPARCPGP